MPHKSIPTVVFHLLQRGCGGEQGSAFREKLICAEMTPDQSSMSKSSICSENRLERAHISWMLWHLLYLLSFSYTLPPCTHPGCACQQPVTYFFSSSKFCSILYEGGGNLSVMAPRRGDSLCLPPHLCSITLTAALLATREPGHHMNLATVPPPPTGARASLLLQ